MRPAFRNVFRAALALALSAAVAAARADDDPPDADPQAPAKDAKPPSKFRSPEDGWLDVSAFLDEPWGFLPIVIPITESAVGYGAAGGLAFIGKPNHAAGAGLGRPNISFAGGLGTENSTWGVFGADLRHWKQDRVQSLVAIIDASVNLDFYGIGEGALPQSTSLAYNLRPIGGIAQAKYRLGGSRAWLGLQYMLFTTDVRFDDPNAPGVPLAESESRVGGLSPSFTYDSRDSMFTAGKGTYLEASFGFFGSALGGKDEFERGGLIVMQYARPHPKVTLGLRGDLGFTFGDAPFYIRPYVSLRGAPVLRYQGEQAASVEAELRWQFWKRFSLVGFVGHGAAWNGFENAEDSQSVTTGGGGVRYEIARRYKLHMGVDVAFGPDGPALYVQFGSAWSRP